MVTHIHELVMQALWCMSNSLYASIVVCAGMSSVVIPDDAQVSAHRVASPRVCGCSWVRSHNVALINPMMITCMHLKMMLLLYAPLDC